MSDAPTLPHIILASNSAYRRELLQRLGLSFECIGSNVDETPAPGENAASLALRLARSKAEAIVANHPQAWVIGSDQVLECNDQLYGKPGHHAAALAQLGALSGQLARFHTSVCLWVPGQAPQLAVSLTQTRYRDLSRDQIERYLAREPAYDCAGSSKAEALGISLCESIRSDDPTALIGLPLTLLTGMFNQAGLAVP